MTQFKAARIWCFFALLLLWAGAVQAATLTLMWNRNPESNVTGYLVSWGTHPGVYVSTLDVGNQMTAQVPGLVAGTPYYFVVQAYNNLGEFSPASVEVSRRRLARRTW